MALRNRGKSLCLMTAFSMCLSGAVGAACTQANMAGAWYSMGTSGDSYLQEVREIDRCKLVVSSGRNGAIVASGSSCTYRTAHGQANWRVTGGALRVYAECGVTGSIDVCDSGFCNTIKVQYAQMARDKNTISMVGYLEDDPDVIFFYKLVKQ